MHNFAPPANTVISKRYNRIHLINQGFPASFLLITSSFIRLIPRDQVLSLMRGSMLFLSTAYRDSGGMGILEACSQGCRVICLDIPSQWWLPNYLACKVEVGASFCETAKKLASAISLEWNSPSFPPDKVRMDYLSARMSWKAKLDELEKIMNKLRFA